MHSVYFLAHPDCGFIGWGLNVLSSAVGGPTLPPAKPLAAMTDPHPGPYAVIVPLQRRLTDPSLGDDVVDGLRRIANDVNDGVARVAFDHCNEAGFAALPGQIMGWAAAAGIHKLDSLAIIAQNRLLASRTTPLQYLPFDLYPLMAWSRCRDLLRNEDPEGRNRVPEHNVLCLNATPRVHRFGTVLALLDAGLVRLPPADAPYPRRIPGVSFPSFDYVKRELEPFPSPEQLRLNLETLVPESALRFVSDVLELLPLRVDDTIQEGNGLAFVVDLAMYRNSKISVVTETTLAPGILRVTEKTMKPVVLGQPFVTIGCAHSLDLVRSFGYRTYDHIIDQSYDDLLDASKRLLGAVSSARDFVARYDADPDVRDQVREVSRQNIDWTASGFAETYALRFRGPLLEFLFGGRYR